MARFRHTPTSTAVTRRHVIAGGLASAIPPLSGELWSGAAVAETSKQGAPGTRAAGVLHPTARQFVESIGVNTHISSEPYASRFETVKRLIRDLGIRHVRDELRPTNDIGRWQELYDTLGVKSQMLVSPATNTIPEMLTYIRRLGRERLSAIEGQNEGDADWFMAHKAARGDWARTVVDYQRDVFEALRRHVGSDLPIVSPTVINWKPADMKLLRDAAEYCDYVAIHSYPQHAEEPETGADFAAVDWYFKHMRDAFKPGAPVMATETGYNMSVKPGGSGVSEAAAALYLPRMLLNNFAAGIERTFLYQLLDGGNDPAAWEHHFGLVRHDNDELKPSFSAIANLIAALEVVSGGKQAALQAHDAPRLEVSLPGAAKDARVLTLRGAGRDVVLAIWRAVSCWDVQQARDIVVESVTIKLRASGAVGGASVAVPNDSRDWTAARMSGSDLDLPVDGKAVLVHLTPAA